MKYKWLVTFIILMFTINTVLAGDCIYVKITPKELITTRNKKIQEGDYVDFVVVEDAVYKGTTYLKKDDVVTGLLIERVENGTSVKNASLFFQQFKHQSMKLNGSILAKGTNRNAFFETYGDCLLLLFRGDVLFIRGGEVKMKPNKDVYSLELEVN